MTKAEMIKIIKNKVAAAWDGYWMFRKYYGKDDPLVESYRESWCTLYELAKELGIDIDDV